MAFVPLFPFVLVASCQLEEPTSFNGRHLPVISVSNCSRDYSEVDFCDKRFMTAFRRALEKTGSDFDFHYKFVSIELKKNSDRWSAAVVDSRTGKVYPLPFDFYGGYVDEKGFPILRKWGPKYGINGNTMCFEGSVYDYRNSTTNSVTCYRFDGAEFQSTD